MFSINICDSVSTVIFIFIPQNFSYSRVYCGLILIVCRVVNVYNIENSQSLKKKIMTEIKLTKLMVCWERVSSMAWRRDEMGALCVALYISIPAQTRDSLDRVESIFMHGLVNAKQFLTEATKNCESKQRNYF